MRVLVVVSALGVMLAAAAAHAAQAPAAPSTPATQKPGGPAPVLPAPTGKTTAPPQQPAPAQLPQPFKDGFKYAYIRFQVVASASNEGKNATAQINALQESRQKEINEKQKALQSQQKRFEESGTVLSDAARAQLETEIVRLQRDIERMVEDARQDIERLQQRLQQEFMNKMNPVIDKLAKEKQVDLIFDAGESGLVWAAPGLDLTTDLIKALDSSAGSKAAPGPAAAPVAPAAPSPEPGK